MDISDDTLDRLASRVALIIQEMSDEAIAVICNRINDLGATTTDAYTLARISEQGDLEEITRIIAEKTALAEAEIKNVFETLATLNDDWSNVYYKAAGIPYSGWSTNQITQAVLKNGYYNVAQDMLNLSRTTAFSYGGYVKTIQATYTDVINKAVITVTTGVGDYRSIMRKTVRQLADSGLRAVEYAPGSQAASLAARGVLSMQYPSGRTLRLDSAVRMNVQDGMRSTVNAMREAQGLEFGADGYEISAHALCAPDHQHIQGQQYTFAEYDMVMAGLTRQLGQMNCKHMRSPVIVGVSSDTYSAEELREFNNNSNEVVTWQGLSGKEMQSTRYEATQYQRQLETHLRTKKSEAKAFEASGDLIEAKRCASHARELQRQYNSISRQMGLSPKSWRTR